MRFVSSVIITAALLLGGVGVLLATPAIYAAVPADLPTVLPVPPTDMPPEVPPTDVPAQDVPPTAVPAVETPEPPVELPPTDVPAQATEVPPPTERPRTRRDPDPTPTSEPPTATPVPPTATPAPRIDISTRKTVDVGVVQRGQRAVYTLLVSNQGDGPAADVVVSDRVPRELEVIDLASSMGEIVVDGQGQVTAFPTLLQPGESATYRITVRVRPDAPAGVVINQASSTTSTPGDDPRNNTSQVEITIEVPPPAAAPPAPPRPPRLPLTNDPTDTGIVWRLLPWALLALAAVGVGGILAYSIVGVQSLSAQLATFMGQWTNAVPDEKREPRTENRGPRTENREPLHLVSARNVQTIGTLPDAPLPPVGPPFAPPPPIGPLPPPVALDR